MAHVSSQVGAVHTSSLPSGAELVKSASGTVLGQRTRGGFCGIAKTQIEDLRILHTMYEVHDNELARIEDLAERKKDYCSYLYYVLSNTEKNEHEMRLDSAMVLVIGLNVLFLSIDMDAQPDTWTFVVNSFFVVIFFSELCLKLSLHGLHEQFCGQYHYSNLTDALLVVIDTIHLTMLWFEFESTELGLISSLFRLVRFSKIVRMLRVLRTHAFADLLKMLQGMLGGISTLAWSLVLLLLFVYIVSLLFR